MCIIRAITLFLLCFILACHSQEQSKQETGGDRTPEQKQTLTAPTGARQVAPEEDGQWLMPAKNYASTRFSGLNQIHTGNVKNLKVAWTFSTGTQRGHEAAPIIVGNTIYIVTPFPNYVYGGTMEPGDYYHCSISSWPV